MAAVVLNLPLPQMREAYSEQGARMRAVDGQGNVHVSDVFLEKTERVSSTLSYVGRSVKQGASDTDEVWQIARIRTVGKMTTTEYVDSGLFAYAWSDRASLFTPVTFNNNFSLDFDGVNDYVTLGDVLNYDRSTAFSISLWIKPQNVSATRYFIGKMTTDSASTGWRIGHTSTGAITIQFRPAGQGFAGINFTTQLAAETWAHVVMTYNGASNANGHKIYVNGALDPTTPGSNVYGYSWATASPLLIGSDRANSYFVGNIDEVAFYGKDLTAAEVSEIYNSGSPPNLLDLSTSGSLAAWWRLGDNDTYPTVNDQVGSLDGSMINMTANDFEADVP